MAKTFTPAYEKSAAWLQRRLPMRPKLALILGSGLSAVSDCLVNAVRIPYRNIPHFPRTSVSFHKGELCCGLLAGVPVLILNGRLHYYEGHEMWETAYPVGVLHCLGVKTLLITNASGGICDTLSAGDFVGVTDHIKLTAASPCRGVDLSAFGDRFFATEVYDRTLLDCAKETAQELGIPYHEGVYAYMSGPQFETPAEVRMLRTLGADVVGMSTVAEVIMAAQCGMRVLCLSCVSNMAAGCSDIAPNNDDVLATAARRSDAFCDWVSAIVQKISSQDGM